MSRAGIEPATPRFLVVLELGGQIHGLAIRTVNRTGAEEQQWGSHAEAQRDGEPPVGHVDRIAQRNYPQPLEHGGKRMGRRKSAPGSC